MALSKLFAGPLGTVGKAGMLLAGGALAVDNAIFTVEPGFRGIIFDRMGGIKPTVYEEGTHFLIPVLQRPILMDARTQYTTISTVTGTKDLQKVNLSLRVLSQPVIQKLPEIYKTLDVDYNQRVLPSIGNEVLKAVVAQYNADQLLTLRGEVSRKIRESLKDRAHYFNIALEDVSITHLNFSKDFSRAIEDKQVAEQMAERAKFVVAKAEQERQAMIIRAEGDAEAAELVSKAILASGRGYIELRRIETALDIARTLATGRGNVSYLPKGGNMLLNLPAKKGAK